jgi:photosystem II stability/assembly factor-like uncharacterized protein
MTKKILSLLFLLLSFIVYSQDSWELLNPKPSYNNGKDVHFVSSQKGYIITDHELLETSDAGQNWSFKQSIASGNDINFKDNIGYIVGYYGFALKTEDYGETWTEVELPINDLLNTVTIIDSNTVIISGAYQLIRTDDGGNSWQILSYINNLTINKSFFVSKLVGHAACQSGTILKTIDGGQNWYITESTNIFPSEFQTIYFVNENIGFASKEHYDILKTTDGGESWLLTEQETPLNEKVTTFFFVNENLGYASAENGVVYKTTNAGNEWQTILPFNSYYGNASFNSLFFTDQYNGYLVGTRGRIMKTVDGMVTSTSYSAFYDDVSQLFPVSQSTIFTSIYDKFYKSTDAGNSWQPVTSPLSNMFSTMVKSDFLNENTGYSIAYGYIFKTIDGALSWTIANNGNKLQEGTLTSVDFVNETTGYASGGKMFKTSNGGISWQQISNNSFYTMQFISEMTGYALNGSGVYKTTDGGINWVSIMPDSNAYANNFHFIDENTGYISGFNSIYKTINGGVSWEQLQSPYQLLTSIKFITVDIGYITEEYGSIFKTTDGGNTWNPVNNSMGTTKINFKGNKIYASGFLGRITKSTVDGVLDTEIEHMLTSNALLLQPNPAFEKVVLTTDRDIDSAVLTDISGRVIIKLKNTLATNSMSITLAGKPAGIYLIKALFTDGTSAVEKLIIK